MLRSPALFHFWKCSCLLKQARPVSTDANLTKRDYYHHHQRLVKTCRELIITFYEIAALLLSIPFLILIYADGN